MFKSIALSLVAMASMVHMVVASDEGVYLADCSAAEELSYRSEMAYYSNARGGSQHMEHPTDFVFLNNNKPVTWDGRQNCGRFGTGETFCVTIAGNGKDLVCTSFLVMLPLFEYHLLIPSKPVGAYAGSGHNDQTNFNCYKDNGRILHSKLYWSLDMS
jgi:hypothetical protein